MATGRRRVVVGAAIVRDGRVLAARRTAPAETAGRWEFPGGKVDDGESDAEEPIGPYLLRVAIATLDGGEPAPTEHDELRWLAPDELDDVDWLEGDRPFLAELSQVLPTL
jgi:8-oxo-dGTP diphosphatase